MIKYLKVSVLVFVLVGLARRYECGPATCYNAIDLSTTANCAATDNYCKVTWNAGGTAVTARACAATCSPGSTESCCTVTNCNDAPSTAAGFAVTCNFCSDAASCAGTLSSYPVAWASATGTSNSLRCKVTFANGVAVSRTAEVCTASTTVACCDPSETVNCNSAKALRTCYQCSSAATCTAATAGFACPSDILAGCTATYDSSSGAAISKACSTGSFSQTLYNEICMTDNCNAANTIKSCYVCANEADCNSTTTASKCRADLDDVCKTEFLNGKAQRKSCSHALFCTPSPTTTCCNTDSCNSAVIIPISCYQCNDEMSCNNTQIGTPCTGSTATTCKTTFVNNRAQSKTCTATADCTAGTTGTTTIACCTTSNCNRSNGSNRSIFKSTFSTNVLISFLLPIIFGFKKQLKQ